MQCVVTLYCYSVVLLLQPAYGLLIIRYGYIGVRWLHFTIMLCYGMLFVVNNTFHINFSTAHLRPIRWQLLNTR